MTHESRGVAEVASARNRSFEADVSRESTRSLTGAGERISLLTAFLSAREMVIVGLRVIGSAPGIRLTPSDQMKRIIFDLP